jgi:4-carboxymuconolactone decarboxylase
MPRIPLPTLESMTPEQRRVYDAVVSGPRGALRGPLRAALHNPELADKWQQLGALLRYRTSLPPRLSELAILVTARHWDCQFEWYAHEPEAIRGGLASAVIEAIKHCERPLFMQADEQVIYDYCSQLHERHGVDQQTYDSALREFTPVGVVELTALCGYYTMVAMTLNAHELPLPDGTPPPLPSRAAPR